MSVAHLSSGDINQDPKRARVEMPLLMGFLDEDKIGTIKPHDDALVITLRIGGYNVKRVMVDQGSTTEIIYPNLYKGLNLKFEDLTPYSSPLVSFEEKIIIPKGQIRLPVQIGSEVVEVDFIVVDAHSPTQQLLPDLGFTCWEQFLLLCTRRLNIRSRVKLKKYWGISLWQCSAWWLPSSINLRPSLRLMKKKTCSS